MDVRFHATLRRITGARTVAFPLPDGTTVRQLLDAVVTRYPPIREELFDGAGALHGHVHVFINGRDAPLLERGLDTVLTEQDGVDVFPAVAGG